MADFSFHRVTMVYCLYKTNSKHNRICWDPLEIVFKNVVINAIIVFEFLELIAYNGALNIILLHLYTEEWSDNNRFCIRLIVLKLIILSTTTAGTRKSNVSNLIIYFKPTLY